MRGTTNDYTHSETLERAVERKYWLDNVKGLLIFFVVFGHFIAGDPSEDINIYGVTHYFIYSVHMPMFILISGYLSNSEWPIKKLFRNYIVPYVICDILWVVYSILRGNADISNLDILTPTFVYWYILCLFFLRVISDIPVFNRIFLLISFAVTFISPCINIQHWLFLSMGRTALLYPIFYFGRYFMYPIIQKAQNFGKSLNCIILFICVFTEYLLLTLGITNVTWATHDYPLTTFECVLKYIFMMITIAIFIGLSSVVSNKQTFLSRWGKNSLLIYLFHPYIVDFLRGVINNLHLRWNGFLFCIVFLLTVFIAEILSNNRIKSLYDRFMLKINSFLHLADK